ncbi:hypothetical protein K0M31_007207, partial [Melipona bicolor]
SVEIESTSLEEQNFPIKLYDYEKKHARLFLEISRTDNCQMARDSSRNGDNSDEGKENDELNTLDPATLRAMDENYGVTSPLSRARFPRGKRNVPGRGFSWEIRYFHRDVRGPAVK